jgi:hypothetical protein
MDFMASSDTRWSDTLSEPAKLALWHAHRVIDGAPSQLSMCKLFRSEHVSTPWEPAPGTRCRRCQAAIEALAAQ